MSKNILILGMSVLRLDKKEGKYKPVLKSNKCNWEGCKDATIKYYSQLEPVSRMLLDKEESLDKIIILATDKTLIKKEFDLLDGDVEDEDETKKIFDNETKEINAVDFYIKRIGVKKEKVEAIPIDVDNPTEAIGKAVEIIREFWKASTTEEEKYTPKLWVDTQGGFRNLNLVMNAILSLLKEDEIVPCGIFSVNYDPENKCNEVKNETDTYKIFDFVSGINEFTRYGRVDQLLDYYDNIEHDSHVTGIIGAMKNVIEDIQMCDMREFDTHLENIGYELSKIGDEHYDLLKIFLNQIKNDYGNLIEKEHSCIDVVEWLYKKKFYQQAITYIESKMPSEWIDKKIIVYSQNDKIASIKARQNKSYESDSNFILFQIVFEWFKRYGGSSISYMDKDKKIKSVFEATDSDSEIEGKLKNGRKEEYRESFCDNQKR